MSYNNIDTPNASYGKDSNRTERNGIWREKKRNVDLLASAFCVLSISFIILTLCAILFVPPIPESPSFKSRKKADWTSLRGGLDGKSKKTEITNQQSRSNFQESFPPLHTSQGNMEEIDHPGVLFSGIERIRVLLPEMNFPTKLSVPKFWNPLEKEGTNIRNFLGSDGNRLMTRDEAISVGNFYDDKETIFVSIASYRDTECRSTLESLYARAKYPERVRVGVVDQIEKGDQHCGEPEVPCDQDPDQVLCKYRQLIDVYEVESYLMVGPVLARHIAHRMYRGEFFAMQVDAHVRFTADWDEDIIYQWKSTGNEMAVLSTYLTDIADSIDPVTHKSLRSDRNMMCNIQYDGAGTQQRLVLKVPSKSLPRVTGSPMLHTFWSAGFSFARGHFVVQVPYDQYLPMVFQGEEANIVIRGFTYGYDFYAPERSVAFHIYAVKENVGRRSRHKFWENGTLYRGALEKSTNRLSGITGMLGKSQKNYFDLEESKYGIGHVRDRDEFFQTFGINTSKLVVTSEMCDFVNNSMHEKFSKFLREDGMGIDYGKIDFKLPMVGDS